MHLTKLNYNSECVNKKEKEMGWFLWISDNDANPLDFIASLSMSLKISNCHFSDKFLISAMIMLFYNCHFNILSKIFTQL